MDVLEFSFESENLRKLQQEIRSLGSVSSSLLLTGETGTGKTTWSQAVCRFDGIAQVVECHEAPKNIKGWREISANWDKQPVILEDVDKWSEPSQSSFSYFVKERKQFKRLVATSSTKILGKVRDGSFRSDVYYVLAVRKVDLPKLTDCLLDFDKIVAFWIEVNGLMSGRSKVSLCTQALAKLKSHQWAGNFTELVNVLERAISFTQDKIEVTHVQFDEWNEDFSELEAGLTLAEVEKKLILQTLNLTAQNKSQAARILGISIRTLRNKLNEYRQEDVHELI